MSILSQISRLKNAKSSIKTAIENKGVTVGSGTIDTYASKIDEIKTGNDYFGTLIAYTTGRNGLLRAIKTIPDNIKISGVGLDYMFTNCESLTSVPKLDTSSITSMIFAFANCPALVSIPELDTSNTVLLISAFASCPALSDDSLNNILKMCINSAVTSSDQKTLQNIGLTESQATKCTTLSNYQAFLNAGWTTGY